MSISLDSHVPEDWLAGPTDGTSSFGSGQESLLNKIRARGSVQLTVIDRTQAAMDATKDLLHELVNDLNHELRGSDTHIRVEYRDRGKHEAEVRLDENLLLVTMHTNVFQFDRGHALWNLPYVSEHPENGYCGVISIYNFLSDSFKYNRTEDLGYLVSRLFINREGYYFAEGKLMEEFGSWNFGQELLSRQRMRGFLESTLCYVFQFEPLVPPYDLVKTATVRQLNTKGEGAMLRVGKRLGFQFNTDDVIHDTYNEEFM